MIAFLRRRIGRGQAALDVRAGLRHVDNGGLRLGTFRELWADEVTERNVALRFLMPEQRVELAPADAARFGIRQGDEVEVRSNGTAVKARATIRERMRPGAVFLIEATTEENANRLSGARSSRSSR